MSGCGPGGCAGGGVYGTGPGSQLCGNRGRKAAVQPQGPPQAAVAYPYYTTRGPRDFFANNPNSIGP
jgi:hypothetical protein